ncbi:tyrosine-type recombinase/integrase [Lentisphaera marina]|uniref:tyrosine-type recombinase/integrase n=1 Tax=Lentisphaera marina TaxID=1111041 RepID=UPI00236555C3|nr:tyrosine-type recombinase/integrase [Lentisphaera marina]MDD7984380.1 tyrosine-type recombinase/integrase [Lentisphaera marina]
MAIQKKKISTGTVYQMVDNGTFYFRYQLKGKRKAVSLKTKNFREAIERAEEMVPVINAPTLDIVAAHVKHASFGIESKQLKLSEAWDTYDLHPDKATPATVSEQQSYQRTWVEFTKFMKGDPKLQDITTADAIKFADKLRKQKQAVDTHNRKIRRIKRIFETLNNYYPGANPFKSPALHRKRREEQDNHVRRLCFTREQELNLLKVLDDKKYEVINKPEIKVLYYIGMFSGQRMKDCALLQWDTVNFDRRRISVKQFKTGVNVSVPISEKLYTALQEAKQWKINNYVLPNISARYRQEDDNGKNTGATLINNDVMRVIKWIGLEPNQKIPGRKRAVSVYGFHSLRHSFASHCAEAGVPKAVTQSILGAASDILDQYYVHIGEDAQSLAIDAVTKHKDQKKSPQEKIDKVLDYISKLEIDSKEIRAIKKMLL